MQRSSINTFRFNKLYHIVLINAKRSYNTEKEKIGAIFYITPSNILETINIFNNVHKHF